MPDVPFTRAELDSVHAALESAQHNALDEERALNNLIRLGHFEDETHRRILRLGGLNAGMRAHRYGELADRVLATLLASAPDTPTAS